MSLSKNGDHVAGCSISVSSWIREEESYLFSIALTHVGTPLYVDFLGVNSVQSTARLWNQPILTESADP